MLYLPRKTGDYSTKVVAKGAQTVWHAVSARKDFSFIQKKYDSYEKEPIEEKGDPDNNYFV